MIYCLIGTMSHDIIKLEESLEFKNEKNRNKQNLQSELY